MKSIFLFLFHALSLFSLFYKTKKNEHAQYYNVISLSALN